MSRHPIDENGKALYRQQTEWIPSSDNLLADVRWRFAITRRSALGGLLLTWTLAGEEEDGNTNLAERLKLLSGRLLFHEDGRVTLLSGKVELGQGSRTLLRQAVAEELRLPLESIDSLLGDTARVPDDGGTWASITTPITIPLARSAAATARQLCIELASHRTGVDVVAIRQSGSRFLAGQQRFSFHELLSALPAKEPVRAAVPLTAPDEWQVLGRSLPSTQSAEIVQGKAIYASDLRMPDLLHARMLRPSHYDAKINPSDETGLRLPPAISLVREGNFMALVGDDALAVDAARKSAQPLIDAASTPRELPPMDKLLAELKRSALTPDPNPSARYPALLQKGNAIASVAAAKRVVRHRYTLPYIAHVPLETRTCIALFKEERLTIWCGTQAPFLVRQDVSRATKVPESRIRVIASNCGSGFGGKQRGEAEVETARIAMARPGRPVRLHWDREEEFQRAYFRPAAVIEVACALDAQNHIQAWEFHNYNAGASSLMPPYAFDEYWCGFHRATSPITQGSYRSLAAVANTFAREMHMEAAAAFLNEDPLALRLRHVQRPRLREVMNRAAALFDWKRNLAAGHARGMSCNIEKDGHLCAMVEISREQGQLRTHRIVIVADFGAALNPGNLRNQIEGGFVQGMGGALWEAMQWDRTHMLNASLSRYRVPRFTDIPPIHVELIDHRNIAPAGAGEAPITLPAPALAAALRALTGAPVLALPLLRA
jgi:nicotinate dehydrogenase subunit B